MNETERQSRMDFLEEKIINRAWYLMDGFWICGFKITATLLVFPLVLATALFFVYSPKKPKMLVGVVFGSSWILMDIFGMISEFYEIPWFYTLAQAMFLLGILLMLFDTAYSFKKFTVRN